MWKKLQVCCYFQAASFLLLNNLGSHCLLWLKRVQIEKPRSQQKWETGASGWMGVWGCGGSLSCLFPLLVKLVSMAGTQGRHCWEWWFRIFDLMAGSFWKGQMLRLGVPVWCLSGALRENPLLISLFPAEAWELNSAWSQRGNRTMPNSSLISEPTPCKQQRNEGSIPRLLKRRKRSLPLGREGCKTRFRDPFVRKQNGMEDLVFCWCLGRDESAKAKIHPSYHHISGIVTVTKPDRHP